MNRSKLFMLAAGLFVSQLLAGTSRADAQACVNNAVTPMTYGICTSRSARPFKIMRLQKDNSYASFGEGWLVKTPDGTTAQGGVAMVYSDRFAGAQPFDMDQMNEIAVKISTNGTVTLHNIERNTATTYTPTCSDNTIVVSTSSVTFLITYGTPFNFCEWPED